eukprot:TRINITY_DN99_c0_g1_i1.p1 TRINITY_DN99_c0_g1~~TRINITY_DN99_c0_g1_i1.p1  ORF type:complete len:244 (+),score=53.04 TRINITY_DN99_c0_g1_i1:42-773(+)
MSASPEKQSPQENGNNMDQVPNGSPTRSRSGSRSPSPYRSVDSKSPRNSRSRSPRSSRSRSPMSRSRSPRSSRSRSPRSSRSRSPRKSYSRDRSRERGGRRSFSPRRRHRDEEAPPNRVLGVFGLSRYTTENELRDEFERFGDVENCLIIKDKQTGESRKFGFVYFTNLDDAVRAKEELKGSKIDGYNIRIDFSHTQKAHEKTPGTYMGHKHGYVQLLYSHCRTFNLFRNDEKEVLRTRIFLS